MKKREEIQERLIRGKKSTGVPVKELKRLCLEAGLELLERGELKVSKRGDKRAEEVAR